MVDKHTLVIRIAGDSGDGIQLVGEQLTLTAAVSGRDVKTLPDFPAEIRAPVGTVAGVSGFQLAMADEAIFTAGETLDILVVMNPAALKHSLAYLSQGGLLIINEDSFTEKDFQKASVPQSLLEDAKDHHQVLSIPLITSTLKAIEAFKLSLTEAKKMKNFYVLGVILWLFDLPLEPSFAFIEQKFKKNLIVKDASRKALQSGFNYAETLELSRQTFTLGQLKRENGQYRQLTGIEGVALALAAVAVCTKTPLLVAGYPITPASGILQSCAKLSAFGISLFQAEDEIAAIGACLGAAFGGRLAITCTSGPGFDLKIETLGLAAMTELPLVVLDVQRAGASTGLPTKTGQSDLRLALYGRHGEAPIPVLAPKTPSDCFNVIIEAFTLAVKYMTPVIVLMDAYLANAAEPWLIPEIDQLSFPEITYQRSPKPFQRDEFLARSWNIPGFAEGIYQVGGLEKTGDEGTISYDANNHAKMVRLRADKIMGIQKDILPIVIEGNPDAERLLVSWGSTYGAMKGAVLKLIEQGEPVAWIHLKHLHPLPQDLGQYLKAYKEVYVAELNTGHLCEVIRAHYLVNAKSIAQCNGQPFSERFIIETLHDYTMKTAEPILESV